MISMIRMDDRLLHGQVAYAWKADLGYNGNPQLDRVD